MDIKTKIRDIVDFPNKGVVFRDITTLIGDADAFSYTIDQMIERIRPYNIDLIVVLDARGFIVGSPIAYEMCKGIVPVRKAGKLPHETFEVSYELEYGTDVFQIHKDAIKPGMRVAIVDDLLATGGTARAACDLVEMSGGIVAVLGFIIELKELKGREKIKDYDFFALAEY